MSKVKQALAPDDALTHHQGIDLHLLRRMWVYLHPYRGIVLLTLILSLASGGLRLFQPLIAKRTIDDYIGVGDMQGVLRMCLYLTAILAVTVLTDILFQYLAAWVGQRAMHDMRRQLFGHVMRQDMAFFDRNPVGRLITRMTSDVGTLNDLFASGVVTMLGELLTVFGVLGLMIYYNLKLTGVVLLSAPFLLPVVYFFRRHSRKWYLETRRCLATLNAYFQENIVGMRTVQSFNRERRNHDQYAALNAGYRSANLHTIMAFAIFFPAMSLISSLVVAGVIWVGGHELIQSRLMGNEQLTFGQLFLFVQCLQMLFGPVRHLSEKYNLLQSAMASAERIFKLLDKRPKIFSPPRALTPPPLRRGVRFENVGFAYNGADPVLRDVSFEIPRGAAVAVVGATGAGKTTLINMMTRFYDVGSGRITIDGVDVREMDLTHLRRHFAVVLQDVFLFSGTIAENLRLARPELTDEQLWEILEQVDARDFVASLPGGLEAEVTERGGTFSTGQKQLLALARAMAADPRILVLDEATANIDTATEQRIQHAIARVLTGRTSLVVAHRLSTIRRADRILVMHHGRLRESGTHEELLALDGLYRRLYDLQYREQSVAS